MTEEQPGPEQRRALFSIVRGEPTDAEVAALTVVLAVATAGAGDENGPPVRDAWSNPAGRVRGPLTVGPGAWRATYLPH